MSLSNDSVKRLAIALTSQNAGNEVATAAGAAGQANNLTSLSVASKGSGDANGKTFTFIAGSAGACTVTIGSVTGITITGSGTAATDATALAAAINTSAAGAFVTATSNSGDVRVTAITAGNLGNAIVTTVTATGGAKLSASGTSLLGGFTAGGYSVAQIVTNAVASTTLAGVLVGDVVVDLTTVAKNTTNQVIVATANTLGFTPVLHDVLVVLRPVPAATAFSF